MSDKSELSQRLEEWVKSTGKRKGEIAVLLGITSPQFSRVLTGKDGIGKLMQQRLQEAGADVDWILTGRKPISGAKGKMIARYFLPNIKAVVIDTEGVQDGINIFIYEEVPPAVDLSVEEGVEIVGDPQLSEKSRIDMSKSAATPILRRE